MFFLTVRLQLALVTATNSLIFYFILFFFGSGIDEYFLLWGVGLFWFIFNIVKFYIFHLATTSVSPADLLFGFQSSVPVLNRQCNQCVIENSSSEFGCGRLKIRS